MPASAFDPVHVGAYLARIPVEWVPRPEEMASFVEVMEAAEATWRDVPIPGRRLRDLIPGCRGRWEHYLARLSEACGGRTEVFVRPFRNHGPLSEIARRFMADILVPIGLRHADSAPVLASLVQQALRMDDGSGLEMFALHFLTEGMDLPSRAALWGRWEARRLAIGSVRRGLRPGQTGPDGMDVEGLVVVEGPAKLRLRRIFRWRDGPRLCGFDRTWLQCSHPEWQLAYRSPPIRLGQAVDGDGRAVLRIPAPTFEGAVHLEFEIDWSPELPPGTPVDIGAVVERMFGGAADGAAVLARLGIADAFGLPPRRGGRFHPSIAVTDTAIAQMWGAWRAVLPRRVRGEAVPAVRLLDTEVQRVLSGGDAICRSAC